MNKRIELIEAFSIEVVERIQRDGLDSTGYPDSPLFKNHNDKWLEFRSQFKPGDEIFGFKDNYGGACGYVLVREGKGKAWFIVGENT